MYESFPRDGIERSYGVIPLRFTGDEIEVLVIQHLSTGEWGFPKGHAEPEDATPLHAAKRELLEETGVLPANLLFDPFTTFFESSYTNPRTGKQKIVVVWAVEIDDSCQVTIQPEEIVSYRFVDLDQVKDVLSFKEDKEHIDRLIPLLLDKRDRRNSKSETYPQIVLFGDSAIASSWKTGGLGQRLAHQYQRRADIINRGFSGYNTDQALQLLPHVFPEDPSKQNPSPSLVVIWFGANDAAHGGSSQHVRPTFYSTNVIAMASHIRQTHARVPIILVSPMATVPHAIETDSAYDNTRLAAQTARKLDIPFADVYSAMQNAAYDLEPNNLHKGLEKFIEDGLHLTSDGYALVHETLMEVIKERLPHLLPARLPMMFPPHARISPDNPEKAFRNVQHYV